MKTLKEKQSLAGKKSSRKGVPNKSTAEVREAFKLLITDNLPNLDKWLNKVAQENPEKALDIIVKFSDFIIPKLQRVEVDASLSTEHFIKMTSGERQSRIIELQKKIMNG
jgi:hypothetical protein